MPSSLSAELYSTLWASRVVRLVYEDLKSCFFKIELVVLAVDVNQHHLIRLNTNFALHCYVTSPRLLL